jgi:hypothetical protein
VISKSYEATLVYVRHRSETAVNRPLGVVVPFYTAAVVSRARVPFTAAAEADDLLELAPALVANALADGQATQPKATGHWQVKTKLAAPIDEFLDVMGSRTFLVADLERHLFRHGLTAGASYVSSLLSQNSRVELVTPGIGRAPAVWRCRQHQEAA